MIKIHRIVEEEHIPLYFKDQLVGYLENELEFQQARIDIREEGVEGYYIIFKDKRIDINSRGRLSIFPKELFCKMDDLFSLLLGF